MLRWCPTTSGGFGCLAAKAERPPPPWAVIHCLNGNLLGALIGVGRLEDPRVQAAIGWAALKELNALARIPAGRRSPLVRQALDQGVAFLFSRDPAVADYPMGWGNTRPSGSWFKPGFPSGYVADVLQTLEVMAALGHGPDPRLAHALAWLESGQDRQGRWVNRYAYNHKTWVDIEPQGEPSKWVTLRACTALRAAYR